MPHYFDHDAIKLFVSRAIADGGRGTQSRLAEHLRLPQPTINKWAQRQTCPGAIHWSGIEAFFDWASGTIAGVGGYRASEISELETAILRADDLDDGQREALLAVYREFSAANVAVR